MTWKKIIRSVLRWNKEDKNAGRDPYIDMACSTHTGNVRAHNEDNFSFDGVFMDEEHQSLDRILCMRQPVSRNPAAALFDGMGGESAGEKASYAAARTFTLLCDEESWDQERLSRVIHRMNEAVCREKLSGRYESMGCTAAVIAFSGGQMLCANLGDSPVFLFRDRRLIQLSVHHTNEALLRERGITGRKPGLTQFLGIEEEDYIIEPQISSAELQAGDLFLLCSDGLTDMCTEEEITEILSKGEDLVSMTAELTDAALRHGGRDNITVILCRVEPGER